MYVLVMIITQKSSMEKLYICVRVCACDGVYCRRAMSSTSVMPFTPLYTPPLVIPGPPAMPVPVTLNPPTVTPLANHPWHLNLTRTSVGSIKSCSPLSCPFSTYPGLPAPSIPAEGLSFGIVQVNDFEVMDISPFEGLVPGVPVIVGFKGISTLRSSIFLVPGVILISNSPVCSSFASTLIGMSIPVRPVVS